jgi:hypothetical protein
MRDEGKKPFFFHSSFLIPHPFLLGFYHAEQGTGMGGGGAGGGRPPRRRAASRGSTAAGGRGLPAGDANGSPAEQLAGRGTRRAAHAGGSPPGDQAAGWPGTGPFGPAPGPAEQFNSGRSCSCESGQSGGKGISTGSGRARGPAGRAAGARPLGRKLRQPADTGQARASGAAGYPRPGRSRPDRSSHSCPCSRSETRARAGCIGAGRFGAPSLACSHSETRALASCLRSTDSTNAPSPPYSRTRSCYRIHRRESG